MSDPSSRLLEAIEAREQKARRVKADWHQVGNTGVIVASDGGKNPEECGNGNWAGIAEFMVDNDPSSVLRHCKADRELLREHGPQEVASLEHETWAQTFVVCRCCAVGDRRVIYPCPTVRIVARGYGITEEET